MRVDINKLYVASKVKRWHTQHGPNQNLAEHSFGVALIISALHPDPSAVLLKAALYHDLHEKRFADVPYDAKKEHEGLGNMEDVARQRFLGEVGLFDFVLDDEDSLWLKFADQYEVYLFLCNPDFPLNQELVDISRQAYKIANSIADKLYDLGFFQADVRTIH